MPAVAKPFPPAMTRKPAPYPVKLPHGRRRALEHLLRRGPVALSLPVPSMVFFFAVVAVTAASNSAIAIMAIRRCAPITPLCSHDASAIFAKLFLSSSLPGPNC